eukprot:PhF_6_TR27301/c0_g2_i1/m.40085
MNTRTKRLRESDEDHTVIQEVNPAPLLHSLNPCDLIPFHTACRFTQLPVCRCLEGDSPRQDLVPSPKGDITTVFRNKQFIELVWGLYVAKNTDYLHEFGVPYVDDHTDDENS